MWLTILEISAFMIGAALLSLMLGWILRGALGNEQTEINDLRQKLRTMIRAQREAEKKTQPDASVSARATSGTANENSTATPSKQTKKSALAKTNTVKRLTKVERDAAQASAKSDVADIIGRVGMGESQDDLTKIHGIGPKFSQMLYDMNITSYAQIAKFRKADIRTVATAIGSFSDRVERDDWVAGAKKVLGS